MVVKSISKAIQGRTQTFYHLKQIVIKGDEDRSCRNCYSNLRGVFVLFCFAFVKQVEKSKTFHNIRLGKHLFLSPAIWKLLLSTSFYCLAPSIHIVACPTGLALSSTRLSRTLTKCLLHSACFFFTIAEMKIIVDLTDTAGFNMNFKFYCDDTSFITEGEGNAMY